MPCRFVNTSRAVIDWENYSKTVNLYKNYNKRTALYSLLRTHHNFSLCFGSNRLQLSYFISAECNILWTVLLNRQLRKTFKKIFQAALTLKLLALSFTGYSAFIISTFSVFIHQYFKLAVTDRHTKGSCGWDAPTWAVLSDLCMFCLLCVT